VTGPDLSPLRAALPSALVALDFDGTLAPISPHPADARPVAGVRQILRDLLAEGATVAVISGRNVSSLLHVSGFADVPGLIIYGTHGAERWKAGELRRPTPPPGLDELRLRLPQLLASVAGDPALWIEDKELSLVIHARLTEAPERVLETLRAPVEEAAAAAGLGVRPGKEVLEICIPGLDKGAAIRELISDGTAAGTGAAGTGAAAVGAAGVGAACYAGDDVGDLDAIGEVQAWGQRTGRPALTIGVSPDGKGPVAELTDVTVPDPAGVVALLRQIIDGAAGSRRGDAEDVADQAQELTPAQHQQHQE
jgi:trehalose 6-phosphate phosphatase